MKVTDLINSIVTQMTMCFPDQEREATFDDALQILTLITIIGRALLDKETSAKETAAMKERKG